MLHLAFNLFRVKIVLEKLQVSHHFGEFKGFKFVEKNSIHHLENMIKWKFD